MGRGFPGSSHPSPLAAVTGQAPAARSNPAWAALAYGGDQTTTAAASPPHLPLPGRVRPGWGGKGAAGGSWPLQARVAPVPAPWGAGGGGVVTPRPWCRSGGSAVPVEPGARESGGWRFSGCASPPQPAASPLIHRKQILFAAGTWGSVRGSGVRWFLPLLFFFFV